MTTEHDSFDRLIAGYERFEQLLADPALYPGNRNERKAFRKWAGDRFEKWYQRGHEIAGASGEEALETFESDWYADGPMAYHANRRADRLARYFKAATDEAYKRGFTDGHAAGRASLAND